MYRESKDKEIKRGNGERAGIKRKKRYGERATIKRKKRNGEKVR